VEGVEIGIMGYEKREFGDFVPFDNAEFYKMIGILFANSLKPLPVFESWLPSMPPCPLMSNF
jgi:hypothetical protein